MTTPTYNERLRQLRQRLGLTQEEMAERFRVSTRAYAYWEAGQDIPGPVEIIVDQAESGILENLFAPSITSR